METIAEKGAGGRAATSAVQGRFKKALIWPVPMALAGVVIWYIRKR